MKKILAFLVFGIFVAGCGTPATQKAEVELTPSDKFKEQVEAAFPDEISAHVVENISSFSSETGLSGVITLDDESILGETAETALPIITELSPDDYTLMVRFENGDYNATWQISDSNSGVYVNSDGQIETNVTIERLKEIDAIAEKKNSATVGEQNALQRAHEYLNSMAFSYSGLIRQLEYEGYTHAEATFGADYCGADWSDQAIRKAKEYLNSQAFSKQGLIDQLKYEGFSEIEARHAALELGY